MSAPFRTFLVTSTASVVALAFLGCPPPSRPDLNDDDDDDDATSDDDASSDDDATSDDDAASGNACEQFVDAVVACYDDAGITVPDGIDYETYCAGYVESLAPYYECVANVYSEGDCGSSSGLTDIATEAGGCAG